MSGWKQPSAMRVVGLSYSDVKTALEDFSSRPITSSQHAVHIPQWKPEQLVCLARLRFYDAGLLNVLWQKKRLDGGSVWNCTPAWTISTPHQIPSSDSKARGSALVSGERKDLSSSPNSLRIKCIFFIRRVCIRSTRALVQDPTQQRPNSNLSENISAAQFQAFPVFWTTYKTALDYFPRWHIWWVFYFIFFIHCHRNFTHAMERSTDLGLATTSTSFTQFPLPTDSSIRHEPSKDSIQTSHHWHHLPPHPKMSSGIKCSRTDQIQWYKWKANRSVAIHKTWVVIFSIFALLSADSDIHKIKLSLKECENITVNKHSFEWTR